MRAISLILVEKQLKIQEMGKMITIRAETEAQAAVDPHQVLAEEVVVEVLQEPVVMTWVVGARLLLEAAVAVVGAAAAL